MRGETEPGTPKPTVARLTHTLTELGYLNYIRRFRKYELGASVLALGYAAISSMLMSVSGQ